tara:strand:- start:411 stop:575 length:165 start_codon:yes stop_codon:yes gene_type:complete
MKDLFTRIRPQIMLFGIALGVISLYSLKLNAVEVTTACVSAIAVLGMKILEDKD